LDRRAGDARRLRVRLARGLDAARQLRRDRAPLHARGFLRRARPKTLLRRGRAALPRQIREDQDRFARRARMARRTGTRHARSRATSPEFSSASRRISFASLMRKTAESIMYGLAISGRRGSTFGGRTGPRGIEEKRFR